MENLFFDLNKLKFIGKNVIIGKCVRIRYPELVSIDDYSIIDDFTYISTGMEIGKYVHIASNVTISGGKNSKIKIDDFSGIASGVSLYTGSANYLQASFDTATIPENFRKAGLVEDIIIDKHVWIGTHSVVMPGVYLPEGFACAVGTIVRKRKNYKPWTLYQGYECRRLMEREHDEYDRNIECLLSYHQP